MSRYAHEDLLCRVGHRHRLLVGDDEDIPVCPTCGEPLMLSAETEHNGTEHVQVWKSVTTQDGLTFHSQEDWHRHRDAVAENLKVPPESIVLNAVSKHQANVKADEAAHRGYLGRKARGVDEQTYRSYVREERRKSGKDERIVVGYRGSR